MSINDTASVITYSIPIPSSRGDEVRRALKKIEKFRKRNDFPEPFVKMPPKEPFRYQAVVATFRLPAEEKKADE